MGMFEENAANFRAQREKRRREKAEAEIEQLKKKIELAKDGLRWIKKNALWGVEANCDAVLAKLEEKEEKK